MVALLGQTNNNAVVFQDLEELNLAELPREITLYSQTTKGTDKFYEINEVLRENGITVKTNDTICRQVSNRDKELRNFATAFDVIVFASGTKSSNGKVLYKVCKDQNTRTYFVSSIEDVKSEWFGMNESVGICGATSTPMWLMEDIKSHLQKL